MLFSKNEVQKFKRSLNIYKFNELNNLNKISESKTFNGSKKYDIFISHSYIDKDIVIDLLELILNNYNFDFTFYIDWKEDSELNRDNITSKNAEIIRNRMKNCSCLIYITTDNHINSKWMPWELGYFDGLKSKVAILPISLSENPIESYKGSEYLGIYPYIGKQIENCNVLGIFKPSDSIPSDSFNNWLYPKYNVFVNN